MKYIFLIIAFICFDACSRSNENKSVIEHRSKQTLIDSLLTDVKMFSKHKEYKDALNLLDRLIGMDSTRGDLFFKRGNCKAKLGKYDESSIDYLKAINLNYKIVDTYFNLALNYKIIGKDSISLNYFILASKVDSTDLGIKIQIEEMKEKMKMK